MNGYSNGPAAGFMGDCGSTMAGMPMMGMMLGGSLVLLLLVVVLALSAAALVRYLRQPG